LWLRPHTPEQQSAPLVQGLFFPTHAQLGAVAQSASAQSTQPSQSSSNPSPQDSSDSGAAPQSSGQVHSSSPELGSQIVLPQQSGIHVAVQPSTGSHSSSVQGFPSSQSDEMPTQTPAEH